MYKALFIVLIVLISGCSTSKKTIVEIEPIDLEAASATEDSTIASLLDNYRDTYDEKMGVRIAEVAYPLEFGSPESTLGNLVADALRFRAAREFRGFVHLSVIGESSFRLNFTEGMLTLGDVLEFMPYQNHLVILKLNGEMVYRLSQQIAERGGIPVSGFRFRLNDGQARQILVNSDILDYEKDYWLATSNWIADGGDNLSAIMNPLERIDFDVSIQDLYIDYFRNQRILSPEKDGRIR